VREELDEFIELVEDAPDGPAGNRVLEHLEGTVFVVANQIPTSDFEDDGFDSVGEFMHFFVEHHGGMIQADGEGFYEGGQLVVPLD